jgi:hypothetical protein
MMCFTAASGWSVGYPYRSNSYTKYAFEFDRVRSAQILLEKPLKNWGGVGSISSPTETMPLRRDIGLWPTEIRQMAKSISKTPTPDDV